MNVQEWHIKEICIWISLKGFFLNKNKNCDKNELCSLWSLVTLFFLEAAIALAICCKSYYRYLQIYKQR